MSTLRELEAAATPGPWVMQSRDDGERAPWYVDTHAYPEGPEPVVGETYPPSKADAALIVAARNALPLLLDVVDAARTLLSQRDAWADTYSPGEHELIAKLAALDSEPLP